MSKLTPGRVEVVVFIIIFLGSVLFFLDEFGRSAVFSLWIYILFAVVIGFLFGIIGCLSVGLALCEDITGPCFFLKDEKIVKVFKDSVSVWRWSIFLKGAEKIYYGVWEEVVTLKLSPITENPKVRNLIYNVVISGGGTIESILRERGIFKGKPREEWLKFFLYEFNEKFSHKLRELFNPLAEAQQKNFYELIREFLEPILEGTEIKLLSAKFDLA